MIWRGICLYR